MDEKVKVLNRYNVFIGKGILSKLSKLLNLKKYSSLFLITDTVVEKCWSKKIEEIFSGNCGKIVLQAGEQSKNIETVKKIWQTLLASGSDRKTLVINLGGGVIGDIGGFSASTYMRGVDFLHIPTTLTAQVDSSIGGKVGVNFARVKNLIGTFNQPIAVVCDINLLSTLPYREFISGFAEIIKHGLIADKNYFNFVISKKPRQFTAEELVRIVLESVKIKVRIVEKDEKESGIRRLLNFGHTIGHAIEALSQKTNNPLLHGEAVSIGMIAEGKISNLLCLLSDEEYKRLYQSLIHVGLPTQVSGLEINEILEKIKSDKKNENGKTNWTLLQGIGKAVYDQKVEDAIVRKVL